MLPSNTLKLNGDLMVDKGDGVMWVDGVTVARYLYIPATVVYIDG